MATYRERAARRLVAGINRLLPHDVRFTLRTGAPRPPGFERFEDVTWTAFSGGDWVRPLGAPDDFSEWDRYVAYATFMDQAWYQDGLLAWKNLAWRDAPPFVRARSAAQRQAGYDYRIDWRTHVALWAAELACRVPGDFMEVGTGRGWMAAAILTGALSAERQRRFFLLDTFESEQVDPASGIRTDIASPVYADGVAVVTSLRDAFEQVVLVQGDVVDTVPKLVPRIERLAFVHFDLNAADPEERAFEALRGRLAPGSVILLDDYGFLGFEDQQRRWDQIAARWELSILAVPTGQGLVIV